MIQYFVSKIVLIYCEKKLFMSLEKRFGGWMPRICKIFEITRKIYSNSEMDKEYISTCSEGFSDQIH